MHWPWETIKPVEVLSPCEGYNRWAPAYGRETNPIKNASDNFILRHLPDVKNKSVLDAGCGTGYFCSQVYDRAATQITGIDISPVMLEEGRKNCPYAEFICADFSMHSLEKQHYDLIICGLVLGHLEKIRGALENLNASLKTGGVLLLTDFHPFQTLKKSKRTFKDQSGRVFEIRHFMHPLPELLSCLHDLHSDAEIVEEPQWNGEPIIYGIKAIKKQ